MVSRHRVSNFRASHRYARITARKCRLIADMIRGLPVNRALEVLQGAGFIAGWVAGATGKTMMDRNAIPAVQDTPETGARDSEELYHAWHGKGRNRYAVTPRFAITSTGRQPSK